MTEWTKKSCIFDENDLIGEGAFSKVYRSNKFTDGSTETTAVKVYQKTTVNREIIDHAKRQQNILKNIQSEYVCSYRQSLESSNNFYMVQKLEEGTTLDKIIEKNIKLQPKEVTKISKAILKGIEYLHSKRIMHRDLKPSNIMYNEKTNKAVLLDLGFATYFHKNDDKMLTFIVGTPNYMSPQILMGKKYNSLSDVWSFGIIMYEMLCGQVPFKGKSEKEILNSILVKNVAFRSSFSPTLEWIILNCLKIDTSQRMKWDELFEWMNTGKLSCDQPPPKKTKRNNAMLTPRSSRIVSEGITLKDSQIKENHCECAIY